VACSYQERIKDAIHSVQNILLGDDVMTHGETVREYCGVFMKSKIEDVKVAVIGRSSKSGIVTHRPLVIKYSPKDFIFPC
jgi:adenine/guanine phosphoribosyltransferase-like PRPP-binding protein